MALVAEIGDCGSGVAGIEHVGGRLRKSTPNKIARTSIPSVRISALAIAAITVGSANSQEAGAQ